MVKKWVYHLGKSLSGCIPVLLRLKEELDFHFWLIQAFYNNGRRLRDF